MGFDRRDIRPSMDVFTLDNVYLGAVLQILPGDRTRGTEERVPEEARQFGETDGEALGPAPTQPAGNRGPRSQSARALYATGTDSAEPIGAGGTIKVGKWWGLIGRRTIPVEEVLSVSLERVVLRRNREELR
jgi:hypothetical protein